MLTLKKLAMTTQMKNRRHPDRLPEADDCLTC